MPPVTSQSAEQTRASIFSFFPATERTQRSVESLASFLHDFIYAPDLPSRLNAFVEVREWTAEAAPSPLSGMNRLETVLALMEARSELRIQFQQGVREILTEIRSVDLFAEAGLHPREGLWSEAVRRLIEEILPSAREDTDLAKFAFRLYHTSEDIDRLVTMPGETFERMARMLTPLSDPSAWAKQQEDLLQALYLLAVHVVGIGLSPGLRARSHFQNIEESPFYQLQRSTWDLVMWDGAAAAFELWRRQIQRCREE